jgi:nitrous oxidase accessory protein
MTTRQKRVTIGISAMVLLAIAVGFAAAVSTGDISGAAQDQSTGNGNGIVLLNSSGNTLTGNSASDNALSGIRLESSDNNTLSKNTASGNTYGITLAGSRGNTVTGNNVSGNIAGAIQVVNGSGGNSVYDNYPDNGGSAGPGTTGAGIAQNRSQSPDSNLAGDPNAGIRNATTRDGNGWSQLQNDIGSLFAPLFHFFRGGPVIGGPLPATNNTVHAVQSFSIR